MRLALAAQADERLQAIEFIPLTSVTGLDKVPDIIKELVHLKGRPAIPSLVPWNPKPARFTLFVSQQIAYRLQGDR
jgi:hypothetical protein